MVGYFTVTAVVFLVRAAVPHLYTESFIGHEIHKIVFHEGISRKRYLDSSREGDELG